MDNKTKAIGGASIAATAFALFHIFHGMYSVSEIVDNTNKQDVLNNAPVYIIQTDSTGKKDTSFMQDYLKKKETPTTVENPVGGLPKKTTK